MNFPCLFWMRQLKDGVTFVKDLIAFFDIREAMYTLRSNDSVFF